MTTLTQQLSSPSRWPSPGADSSSRLALELAMSIKPVKSICEEYDIKPSELKVRLKTDAQLRLQVNEYAQIWNHPMNAKERVQIKSAVMAEDGLMDIWKIFTNPEGNPAVRLDCHRHLTKLADVEPKRDAAEQGSRFSVTINLPGESEPMRVVAQPNPDPAYGNELEADAA